MNLSVLLDGYKKNSQLLQLVSKILLPNTQKIYLKNLQGSSAEFIVSSIFSHPHTQSFNHLVILNDAEEAAYFHNTYRKFNCCFTRFILFSIII
jgi:transcription-repair coupling factor (superfamily II helicase)